MKWLNFTMTSKNSISVWGEVGAWLFTILVFSSPTGYTVWSFSFIHSFIWGLFQISLKRSVIFLKSRTWTRYIPNCTGSSVTRGQFSPLIDSNQFSEVKSCENDWTDKFVRGSPNANPFVHDHWWTSLHRRHEFQALTTWPLWDHNEKE